MSAAVPPIRSDDTWKIRGLCRQADPELFYPEKGGSTREAKRICGNCPVRAQCLAWAVDTDERHGVWGGLSERERRRLRPEPARDDLLQAS